VAVSVQQSAFSGQQEEKEAYTSRLDLDFAES